MKQGKNLFKELIREEDYREETLHYERHALKLYPLLVAFFCFGYGFFLLFSRQEALLRWNHPSVFLWLFGLISLLFSKYSDQITELMTLERVYHVLAFYCISAAVFSCAMWIVWKSVSIVMFFMFIVSSSIIWLSYRRYLLFSLLSLTAAYIVYIWAVPDPSAHMIHLIDNVIVAVFAVGINLIHTSEQHRSFRLQQQLEHDRDTDALTELKNRKALGRNFHHAVSSCQVITVVLIDVDNFKAVNDTFGHQTGDQVLVRMARILKNTFRSSDIVARVGGDEFVVLMPLDWIDLPLVEMKLKGLLDQVPIQITDGTHELLATFSVGAHLQPVDSSLSLDELIETADEAMYRSKKAGKNRVTIHNTDGSCITLSGHWDLAEGRIIRVE